MNQFKQNVFKIVRLIPKGKVTSYGSIGKAVGVANSARMVGRIMSESGMEEEYVPAHRVVNSTGLLTGKHHFSSPTKMEELLAEEGIKVKNNKIVNFKQHYWDPLTEINFD